MSEKDSQDGVNKHDGLEYQKVTMENLEKQITNIQKIGNYNADETPFDMFDTGCHDETITPYLESKEENITFMINVSEHVKRS